MQIASSHSPALAAPRRRVALVCLAAFAGLAALVITHVVDAADLRAELLLASVIDRLDLAEAVGDLYVSSEMVFVALLALGIGIAWLTGRVALRRVAIEVPLALVAAEGFARALAPLIERPRPFVAHPAFFAPLGGAGIDPSFPSDGATAAFAIATVVALSCRRLAIPALAIAALVAIGRLLVAVHYPTDVLGGALVGVAAAVLVCRLSRHVCRVPADEGELNPPIARLQRFTQARQSRNDGRDATAFRPRGHRAVWRCTGGVRAALRAALRPGAPLSASSRRR